MFDELPALEYDPVPSFFQAQQAIYETPETQPNLLEMLKTLKRLTPKKKDQQPPILTKSLHIGFGCFWTNIEIIATRKPEAALFASNNYALAKVLEVFQFCLTNAENRFEFCELFLAKMTEQLDYVKQFEAELELSLLTQSTASEHGFLGSDENYKFIKDFFSQNALKLLMLKKISSRPKN